MTKEEIENIFRNSNDSNQLFDAFHDAIELGIKDIELYKVLIGNPTLSQNEISMYTEKVGKDLPESKFELFLWTADLFGTKSFKVEAIESAVKYYRKAAELQPASHIPYINALNLYNYDIEYSINRNILDFVIEGIPVVNKKSVIYKSLADHYKKINDKTEYKKYCDLFEKTKRRENN